MSSSDTLNPNTVNNSFELFSYKISIQLIGRKILKKLEGASSSKLELNANVVLRST